MSSQLSPVRLRHIQSHQLTSNTSFWTEGGETAEQRNAAKPNTPGENVNNSAPPIYPN